MPVDTLARMLASGKTPVDAYAIAVAGGYTGTKEQFDADVAASGTNASNAASSASAAASSAESVLPMAGNYAPAYSSSGTYSVGDLAVYDGLLYECVEDIPEGEEFDASKWKHVNITPRMTNLLADLKNALDTKADVITDSASGAVASFPDGMAAPVVGLTVGIEPVQDLHGYDSPWPAGGGKNKWNPKPYTGLDYNIQVGTVVSLTDGASVTVNNNVITYPISTSWGYIDFKTDALPAGTYNIHFNIESSSSGSFRGTIYVVGNNGTNDVVKFVTTWNSANGDKNYQVTVEANDYIVLQIGSITKNVTLTITNFQIESGSSFTSWVPYENVCPISGWTGAKVETAGKNIIDIEKWWVDESIESSFVIQNGKITVPRIGYLELKNHYVLPKPNTTYKYSFKLKTTAIGDSRATVQLCSYSSSGAKYTLSALTLTSVGYTSEISGTIPSTAVTISFGPWAYGGTIEITDFQLELGSTATSYAPYSGSTYSISWQSEAGTVYGGSLDVTTGVLTVDRARILLGSLNWTYSDTYSVFKTADLATSAAGNVLNCSDYEQLFDLQTSSLSAADFVIAFNKAVNGNTQTTGNFSINALIVKDSRFTTPSAFITAVENVELVYLLATPQTYQLDPVQLSTLLGENNIWADTGDTAVEYRADTKKYIDKKLAALVAQIVNS